MKKLDNDSYEKYYDEFLMKVEYIQIPIGWCVVRAKPCPDNTCPSYKIHDNYYDCSDFRKVCNTRAIAKTDEDGKRRVYLTNPEGTKPVGQRDRAGCYHTSGQTCFSDRAPDKKITRPKKS